jgi:FkbM family methyltransferase
LSIDIVRGDKIIRISERHDRFMDEINRHFDTYFNAVEKSNGLVDFSTPDRHTYGHNGLEFMLSFLPEEPEIVGGYFRHQPTGARLAFDIGAYCGLSTYELSLRFDKVIAFEPDTMNRDCLNKNILRHNMRNVMVVPMAIMGESGRVRFLSEGTPGSGATLADRVAGPSCTIDALSLVDACLLYGIPDFICMDIEEAEVEVLEAARELLTREHIGLVVDTAHGVPITAPAVEEILKDCGYSVETDLTNDWATTWGWK